MRRMCAHVGMCGVGSPAFLRDLALTLQMMLQWKRLAIGAVAVPKLSDDIGQAAQSQAARAANGWGSRSSPALALCWLCIEARCVDLLIAGFESFFPTIEERVGIIHALTNLALNNPAAATSASAAAAPASASGVRYTLSGLGRRYDVDHRPADLSSILFAVPDASIAAPGSFAQVTDILLQIARSDWHGAAAAVPSAALSRKHRPHGRCVEHADALTSFLCVYLSQLFTALSGAAVPAGPPAAPSTCWPLFLQFLQQLSQHCSDSLDYMHFIHSSQSASKNEQADAVAATFHRSQLSRLLHFTLPLMRQALQSSPSTGRVSAVSASSVASMHAVEIGAVLQTALALLVRLGALHPQSSSAAGADPSGFPSAPFRGSSLRSMLSLLRQSHQYTTTVYRQPSHPSVPGATPSHLANILVPFASKVLSGLFWRFAITSRRKRGANAASGKDGDKITMTREEFTRYYSLGASSPPSGPISVPVGPVHAAAATAEGTAASTLHAPLPPLATMFSLATPVAIPSATAAALSTASFVLPSGPAPIQRSHTAAGLSSIAAHAPAAVSLLSYPPPSSALHFHLDHEWHKAVSCCTGSTSSSEIDLAGFLKWNLDGFVEDSRAKIEQLRNIQHAIDWSREEEEEDLDSSSGPEERSARAAIGDLVLQLQDSFATLLQEHVYPVTSASHTTNESVAKAATAPAGPSPLQSSDDLDTLPSAVAARRLSFDRSFPAVAVAPSRSPPAAATVLNPAAAAAAAASAEFLPRLMESEARWTHHPAHQTFLGFLDKFTQQAPPVTTNVTATTSKNDRARRSASPTADLPPLKQKASGQSTKDSVDFTLPQPALPDRSSPPVIVSTSLDAPVLLDLPVAAVKNSAQVASEVSSKQLSEQRDDEKISSKESSANNTPRTASAARRVATTLTVSRSPSATATAPAISPQPSPMVPEAGVAATVAASEFPGGELEEPARCFSSLFLRCLSEMGGGSAKKKIESWPAALQAEKSFAAACIKHNGLCPEVFEYSSSVAAVELLRLSLAVHPLTGLPRVRLLSHPTCPHWLKAVVQSTFQEVRTPLLQIMRAIEEEEETMQQSAVPETDSATKTAGTDTAATASGSTSTAAAPFGMLSQPSALFHAGSINSSMVARTVAAKKCFKALRKLAAQARAMVLSVHANSRFLVRELDGLQRSLVPNQDPTQHSQPQVSPVGEDGEGEEDASGSDEEVRQSSPSSAASADRTHPSAPIHNVRATMPTRYRTVAQTPAASSVAVHMPSHLLRAAAFHSERSRSRQTKPSFPLRMPSRMHESASSVTLQQPPPVGTAPSDFAKGDDQANAPAPPAPLARQHSEIVRRRRHSVLTISPGFSVPTVDAAASPPDDDSDGAQATAANISGYLRGAERHGTAAPESSPSSELWSNWSTSASSVSGRAPYESKWLATLVHCGSSTVAAPGEQSAAPPASTLRDLLHPSIQRFQSVCILRMKLLSCINGLCSDHAQGFDIQLVDHIFPVLHTCLVRYPPQNQESHLLHYGRLIMRVPHHDRNKNVLLHFLKHLVAAVNSQLTGGSDPGMSPGPSRESSDGFASSTPLHPVSYSDPAWLRIRSCLHLLRLDFLAEDTESIVGSGVFAALFRTIRHIDDSIQAAAAAMQHQTAGANRRPRSAGSAVNMSPSPSPILRPMESPTAAHAFQRMPSWELSESSVPFPAPSPFSEPAATATASQSNGDQSLPLPLRFAAAYHLKFLCWQTLKYLTLFVLSQHQRGVMSNSVLLSSVARQFVRMLVQQLQVMAQAPPKLPLQQEDGSLMFTLDAATILCQFAKFKAVCDAHQMEQLMQLSTAAPASIQTLITRLIASEFHRLRPADLDAAAVTSAGSASPLSVLFVQQMFARIGQKLVANSVLPSVCQTQPTGPQHSRQQSVTADSVTANNQLFSPILPGRIMTEHSAHMSLGTPSLPTSAPLGSRQSSTASVSSSAGDDSRPPFWHESGYQSWRFYPHFHAVNLQSEPALMEEMIVALRSLLSDRHWRPIIVQQLQTQLAQLPPAVQELRKPTSSSTLHSWQSGLAALAVLGGHTFQLRKGALVEVLLHARRSVRGTVVQIDTHLCRVLVSLSPSQPHAATRPFARANQTGAFQHRAAHGDGDFHPAPPFEQEFSFDQVRACPILPAPLLTDLPGAVLLWGNIRESMQTAVDVVLGPNTASQPPSLATLLCMQVTKQLVQLLQVQLSAALSKTRRQTSARQGSGQAGLASTQASPTMSPLAEPMGSPVSPHGSGGDFSLNAFGTLHAYPSPASSPDLSPEPASAGGVVRAPTSILSQLQSAAGQTEAAGVRSPAASNLRIVMQEVPAPAASAASRTSDSMQPSPHPAMASVDFTSFLPLLLRLSSSVGHRLLSLSLFELEQSSALFSRRLWEVIKAEQKHTRLWECAASANATPREKASEPAGASSLTSEIAQLSGKSDRVTFVPFASLANADRAGTDGLSSAQSYRQALISALRHYFTSARSQAAARSRVPRLRSQPLPRLLIFPLQGGSSNAAAATSSSSASCESGGILVVEVPASGFKRDQPECKEAATESDVPRLLTLADLGITGTLASSILPLGPSAAEDSDEAEAEAMELVLGTGCHPEQWTAERWAQELDGQALPGQEGRRSTAPTVPRAPQPGHVSVLSRRVIIGPNGQAAVLTSATPATSRANSPSGHRAALQVPSIAIRATQTSSPARGPQSGTSSAGHSPNAGTSSSSSSSAAPPLGGHLAAKFVRTTTQAERQALVDHIAAVSRHQSPNPARWQLYDFVDARDSYGDWYLAQIIGFKLAPSRDDTPSTVREAALLHFFAWDDMYREWIALSAAAPPGPPGLSDESLPVHIRLRPASLFAQSVDRLDSDRFIRKVKVFGREVVDAMKKEREAAALALARDQAKQIASIALSDAYSYPLCAATFAGSAGTVGQKLDGSALSVGTQVLVTGGCVELLSLQLGRGLVDVSTEYRVGDRLMVLDTVNKLCEAEILECRSALGRGGSGEIKIHYIGWPSKWDEVLPVTSERIQSKRGFGAAASAFKNRNGPMRSTTDGGLEDGSSVNPAVESKKRAFASWNGARGHAAQLIGLVGQIAVITKLAQAPRSFGDLIGDRLESASAKPASDTLAQVQLLDPLYGSLVCFWTRLQLLRRMDQVDVPHISLPGLLQCDSAQLRAALYSHEQLLIGGRVSQVVQAIVKSQTTTIGVSSISDPSNAGPRKEMGADFPLSPTLLPSPTNGAASNLLSPSLAGSLPSLPNLRQEASVSWPASVIPGSEVVSSDNALSSSAVRPSLPTPAHPAAPASAASFLQSFREILASLPRVSQLVLASHVKCASGLQDPCSSAHNVAESSVVVHPRHRPHLSAAALERAEAQRRHTFVKPEKEATSEDSAQGEVPEDSAPQLQLPSTARTTRASPPLAASSAPQTGVAVSSSAASDPEPLVVQAWLGERLYRNLNAVEWDKLEILGSVVALLLGRGEDSKSSSASKQTSDSAMRLPPGRIAFLSEQCVKLSQTLLAQFNASRGVPLKNRNTLDPSSALADPTVMPAAASSHIQTIRPGEVVRLFSAQPGVHSLLVCWTRSSQPNFEVNFISSTGEAQQGVVEHATTANASASSSSASWYSASPSPPPPPPPIASKGTPICPLAHLKSVPVLRTGASPLLLPNPCYLVSSLSTTAEKRPAQHSSEDETEAADDDFSILVTPLTSVELEAFAAFTEVVLHLRREVRISPALAEEPAVVSTLDKLLLQTLRCWVDFLSLFQSVCPWPCARYKGLVFELVAHLMAEITRSLHDTIEAWSSIDKDRPFPALMHSLSAFGFSWLHPFVLELRDRYTSEKENWPLFSSYTHRGVEMMVAALQLEAAVLQVQESYPMQTLSMRQTAMASSIAASLSPLPPSTHYTTATPVPMHHRVHSSATGGSFRPILSAMVSPRSESIVSFADAETEEYAADGGDRVHSRSDSPTPSSSTNRGGPSRDSPSIYTTPPPGSSSRDEESSGLGQVDHLQSSVHSHHSGLGSAADEESLAAFIASELPVVADIYKLILEKRHLFVRCSAEPRGPKCACNDCRLVRGENPSLDNALMLLDFASSLWPLLLGGSMLLLPHAARYRLFDELLNVTASPERWLPEFPFTTLKERALAKELAMDLGASPSSPPAPEDNESDSTWQQLCKALKVTPEAHLRGKLGDVTWKARFKGLHNRGAEGLPGPFRQSLTEICSDLRTAATAAAATTGSSVASTASVSGAAVTGTSSAGAGGRDSILIPAPNFVYDTGLDRNKLILNPLPVSADGTDLSDSCFRFGQLLGVAIRSQGVLDIDMASLVWKLLADEKLTAMDLASVDYTAVKQMQFRDADTGVPLSQAEFNEQVAESLSWTTTLSDGVTKVELVAGGAHKPVQFAQRHQYARAVLRARLEEARLSVNNIRQGLYSVVPARAIQLLTWRELELRVCGSPQLDLDLLARHTVYAPKHFGPHSDVVRWFWKALREFSTEEQAKFMQFSWARSRLPPESGKENTWRMKVRETKQTAERARCDSVRKRHSSVCGLFSFVSSTSLKPPVQTICRPRRHASSISTCRCTRIMQRSSPSSTWPSRTARQSTVEGGAKACHRAGGPSHPL